MFMDWGISLDTTLGKRTTFVRNLREMKYLKMIIFLEEILHYFRTQVTKLNKTKILTIVNEDLYLKY
jgi:hypothetical protein